MDSGLLILMAFLHVGVATLQSRWVASARGRDSLQDRCLIPLIISVLLSVLAIVGLRRASGWDALGWFALVHFCTVPLTAAVGIGTLVGLWLRRKKSKAEKTP